MKKMIHNWIYPPIIDLIKYLYYRHYKGSFFAKDQLDKKLLNYINYNSGFYVELGANNGFSQSNSLYYEIKKGWRGILIEPSPNLYLQCCYFRNADKNSIFCNACVDFEFREKYVDMHYGNLMTTSDSLTLDLPAESDFFNKRRRHSTSQEHNLRFGSEASTLTEILDIGNAPHVIDLLSVDVEGAELSVLSGIDFSKYRFKYILIETRASKKIIDFMTANSYHYIKHLSNHDLLFSYRIHD